MTYHGHGSMRSQHACAGTLCVCVRLLPSCPHSPGTPDQGVLQHHSVSRPATRQRCKGPLVSAAFHSPPSACHPTQKGPAVYRSMDAGAGGEGGEQPVLEAYEHPRVKEARLQASKHLAAGACHLLRHQPRLLCASCPACLPCCSLLHLLCCHLPAEARLSANRPHHHAPLFLSCRPSSWRPRWMCSKYKRWRWHRRHNGSWSATKTFEGCLSWDELQAGQPTAPACMSCLRSPGGVQSSCFGWRLLFSLALSLSNLRGSSTSPTRYNVGEAHFPSTQSKHRCLLPRPTAGWPAPI